MNKLYKNEVVKGVDLRKELVVWMELYWGERCKDFEPDCGCCKAWKAFDVIFEGLDEISNNWKGVI